MNFAILLCPGPQSPDWELPLRDPTCLLLGWVVEQESLAGGVPWPVRKLLSQVLCRMGIVTYLAHDGVLVPGSKHKTVSTREVSIVSAMFDDQAYPWTQHGQAGLLAGDAAPAVSSRLLTEVVGRRQVEAAERAGFTGVLLPGVDGAVAGLWIFHPDGIGSFQTQLEECCTMAGAELHLLNENEFRLALSS